MKPDTMEVKVKVSLDVEDVLTAVMALENIANELDAVRIALTRLIASSTISTLNNMDEEKRSK